MNRHGGLIRSAIGPLLHSSILFRPHQQRSPKRGLVVEAPGYCPPGPKCLFHPTIYRHSRLPGTPEIGISAPNLKDSTLHRTVVEPTKRGGNRAQTADMGNYSIVAFWGLKDMKRLV